MSIIDGYELDELRDKAAERDKFAAENERLKTALKKIAIRYPCSTVLNMQRVARDAIGNL